MQQVNKETLLRFGLPGLLVLMLTYASPFVIEGWQMSKTEDRLDRELSATAWGRYAHRLEEQLEAVNKALIETNTELAAVKAEMRLIRSADYFAPIAMWELDRGRRVKWFNAAYADLVLTPQNIEPETTYGKRWEDIFPPSQAKEYTDTDAEVLETRLPVTFRTWTLGDGGQREYWKVIKWPIINQSNALEGIKGIAIKTSIKEE